MQRHQGFAAGLAAAALVAWSTPQAAAASFATLYNFVSANGATGDGNNPYAGLTIDNAGNLYGTTYAGGAAGLGAVFELSPPSGSQTAWSESILYSFHAGNRADGIHPTSRLVLGPRGELYGHNQRRRGANGHGRGTVFELIPPAAPGGAWTEATLHVFTATGGDGATPYGGLVIDAAGTLYGTTSSGGADAAGAGTVFSLAPSATGTWTETILHEFTDADSGVAPQTDLLLGPGATLYGTTPYCSSKTECSGTVFAIRLTGGAATATTLYKFAAGGVAGEAPASGLTMDAGGALYGATSLGIGTAFRLAPPSTTETKWKETVLARFASDKMGGPEGGVQIGPGGALYGTLTYGAHRALGTIYKLTPPPSGSGPWPQTVLYAMPEKPKGGGVNPVGNLVADRHGALYGVTEIGGAGGVGTVFKVTP